MDGNANNSASSNANSNSRPKETWHEGWLGCQKPKRRRKKVLPENPTPKKHGAAGKQTMIVEGGKLASCFSTTLN
jgi:hypothetical protein